MLKTIGGEILAPFKSGNIPVISSEAIHPSEIFYILRAL